MKKDFNPMRFLASLGAGGIAVAPFAIMQYTFTHPKGLIQLKNLKAMELSSLQQIETTALMIIMALFTLLHFALSVPFFADLLRWRKTDSFKTFMSNPQENSAIMAPYLSLIMTMNVFIGPIRFFFSIVGDNLQLLMLPALMVIGLIWLSMMKTEIGLLKRAFSDHFDADTINFGWLIQVFALSMGSVTLSGIAALAKAPNIAHTAFVLTSISFSMALFLLMIKLPQIFKNHFHAQSLPEHPAMPSVMILVPIITLLAITGFRLGHYMEKQLGIHLGGYFLIIVFGALAMESWYLIFSLSLIKGFLQKDLFKKEYYVTMWGMICPFVAFSVLSAFAQEVWLHSAVINIIAYISLGTAVGLFLKILHRKARCLGWFPGEVRYNCGEV